MLVILSRGLDDHVLAIIPVDEAQRLGWSIADLPEIRSTSRAMSIVSASRGKGRLTHTASMAASALSGLPAVKSFATVERSIGMNER